ncbi:MAG: MarR family winged helix-turn-helix transcriptional regulator, partial [Solirubrobacteraceae bacterium]
ATPVQEVADRLHSASIHLLRHAARGDAASGLSAARLSALSVIVFQGPLTVGELATAARVSQPTVTRTLQGLEAAGLISRHSDPTDGRVVRVRATGRGARLLQRARRRRVTALASSLGALSRHDLASLSAAAEIMERALAAERPKR